MSKFYIIIIIAIFIPMIFKDKPAIKLKSGIIAGKLMRTRTGRTFLGFTGIPYAEPPVGELRFKAPVPIEPRKEMYYATETHPVCPQLQIHLGAYLIIGNEDCLYLNVYTPKIYHYINDSLPVMFYIHGGSFTLGSAREDWVSPRLLLDEDVILVVPNYRLGALGFLSTMDQVAPGNNGLKDQNLALKWTKENIDKFGGDPNRITVFGNSAGAVCAQYHMISPLSKGLLNRIIIQSGFALEFYALASEYEAKMNAKTLSEFLNCPTKNSNDMIACLRKPTAKEIVRQEINFLGFDNDTTIPFRPVIEQSCGTAFLVEDPIEMVSKGQIANIPLMTGIVSQEGAYKAAGFSKDITIMRMLHKDIDWLITANFGITSNLSEAVQMIKDFYFGNKSVSDYTIEKLINVNKSENMYTDGYFLLGLDATVRSHMKHSTKPIYKYLFEYRGSTSYSEIFGNSTRNYGVCHTDELLYLLPQPRLFPDYVPSGSDERMIEILTKLWTNFAKTGNPTPEINSIISTIWNPIQSNSQEYYRIKHPSIIVMDKNLYSDRLKLWKNISLKINKI